MGTIKVSCCLDPDCLQKLSAGKELTGLKLNNDCL